MRIIYTGRASEVAASVKALADQNGLLTLEQYLKSLVAERRAIAAISGKKITTTARAGQR